jgi:hypothetical protein
VVNQGYHSNMGKRSPHEATAEESRPFSFKGASCRH